MLRQRGVRACGPDRPPIDSRGARGLAWCATAIIVLSILSAAATAEPPRTSLQQAAAESDHATIDSVTVEARRQRELLQRQISTYVSAIAVRSRTEALARWQLPICPLVAGLPFDQGKFVFQRVSQVASDAGLPLGPTDCKPNLLIVMTREPETLLENWWDAKPQLFNTDRGAAGIKRKIRSAAPVRVFHNACSVPPGMAKTFGAHVFAYCGMGMTGSRLKWSTVRAIYSVVIVVDKRLTEGVALGPLTDYIAMISLAQIKADPDPGTAPTILRLFDDSASPRPQALSTWDRAFLKSLYDTDSGNVAHLSEIKRRMDRDLAQ